jgi:hypothetical protein
MSELGFLTECPLCHQTFWVAEANDVVPRHDDPARGTWCAGSKYQLKNNFPSAEPAAIRADSVGVH